MPPASWKPPAPRSDALAGAVDDLRQAAAELRAAVDDLQRFAAHRQNIRPDTFTPDELAAAAIDLMRAGSIRNAVMRLPADLLDEVGRRLLDLSLTKVDTLHWINAQDGDIRQSVFYRFTDYFREAVYTLARRTACPDIDPAPPATAGTDPPTTQVGNEPHGRVSSRPLGKPASRRACSVRIPTIRLP